MPTFVVRVKRRVIEYVDVIVEAEDQNDAVADVTDQHTDGHLSDWEYLIPPNTSYSVREGLEANELSIDAPGLFTEAGSEFLRANDIESPEALLRLGFATASSLPGAHRAVIKGLFAAAEAEVTPKYRDQARSDRSLDDGIKIDDDAEVSFGNDRGAWVAAWVWVSSDDI